MTVLALSPEEFASAWGLDALIRLSESCDVPRLPTDTHSFLVRAGLPALMHFQFDVGESKVTFCRLASGLSALLNEEIVGGSLRSDWSGYWILGDEFFSNGSAWWCIHEKTGHIVRIDVESDPPIEFANSSVAQFASAANAAIRLSDAESRSCDTRRANEEQLADKLRAIDPACVNSDRSFWTDYLDFIRHEDSGGLRKGSLSDGYETLQIGPW